MRALTPGDVLTVTKLDRLARSSRDQHNILHSIRANADVLPSATLPARRWRS
jgi:DNA invertase Pin-like site-specific DNA recombinase